MIFLDRHRLQTSTALASGLPPCVSTGSTVDGEFFALSVLRFVGLVLEVDGWSFAPVAEPLGSPLELGLMLAMVCDEMDSGLSKMMEGTSDKKVPLDGWRSERC